jgi:hypothetical protein
MSDKQCRMVAGKPKDSAMHVADVERGVYPSPIAWVSQVLTAS